LTEQFEEFAGDFQQGRPAWAYKSTTECQTARRFEARPKKVVQA